MAQRHGNACGGDSRKGERHLGHKVVALRRCKDEELDCGLAARAEKHGALEAVCAYRCCHLWSRAAAVTDWRERAAAGGRGRLPAGERGGVEGIEWLCDGARAWCAE